MSVNEALAKSDLASLSESEWDELREQLFQEAETDDDYAAIHAAWDAYNERSRREALIDQWGRRPVMERVEQLRNHLQEIVASLQGAGTELSEDGEILPLRLLESAHSDEAMGTLAASYRIRARQQTRGERSDSTLDLLARMFTAVSLGYNGIRVLGAQTHWRGPLPSDLDGSIRDWFDGVLQEHQVLSSGGGDS